MYGQIDGVSTARECVATFTLVKLVAKKLLKVNAIKPRALCRGLFYAKGYRFAPRLTA